ncbi:MAG TPA: hypothetical protein VLX28_00465 [Thermoanaerobaculia bacterium]|nr:hypothetical protein [Thermoanaerobaculia bacterium]
MLKQPRQAEPTPKRDRSAPAVEERLQPAVLYRVSFRVSSELVASFRWGPGRDEASNNPAYGRPAGTCLLYMNLN